MKTKSGVAKTGRIEKKVLIQASPAVVYQALTDAKDLTQWFCDRASSQPEEGGELKAYWKTGKSGHTGRAVYRQMVPESVVELVWIDDGEGPLDAREAHHCLSYRIRHKRGCCEVLMRDEDEPPPDQETFAVLSEGWNSALLELKDFCEHEERAAKNKPVSSKTHS